MAQFWPTLRRPTTKALVPALADRLPDVGADPEFKIVLANYYAALAAAGLGPTHRARPWDVERAVAEGYERVVWVFKAVDAIASNQASLPFVVKEGDEVVEDHPLSRLLNDKKANPLETGKNLRYRLSSQILLSKVGAFVEVTESRAGTPVRLDLLPPGRTRIVAASGADLVSHVEVTPVRGGTPRSIDWERVRWFRKPHPLDPFSGITPLEAAGLSVELDFFARLYNISFLRNDGRPGGILGVDGEMEEEEMDRVESRFGKGPVEAGKLSVINGRLTYVDVAAKPRDMQYGTLSRTAKVEILVAFGVPESQLGNAAERTFANADEEGEAFWLQTMNTHCDMVTAGFDEDTEDEQTCDLDRSGVAVLARVEEKRRQEAREEVAAGTRSIDEYRPLAGLPPLDNAFTRALYLPSGKTPIPARDEDAAALGLATPSEPEAGAPVGADAEQAPTAGGPQDADGDGFPDRPGSGPGAAAADAVARARAALSGGSGPAAGSPTGDAVSPAAAAVAAARQQAKAAPRRVRTSVRAETKAERDDDVERAQVEQGRADLEEALAVALRAVSRRHVARTQARLRAPKNRRGTRHYRDTGKGGRGDEALDATKIVDADTWRADAEEAARPVIDTAAAVLAAAVVSSLLEDGGPEPEPVSAETAAAVADAVTLAMAEVYRMIGTAAFAQALATAVAINAADQAGATLDEIVAEVGRRQQSLDAWADAVAVQASTATANAARVAAADEVATGGVDENGVITAPPVLRVWRSRRDDRVRPSHRAADGQVARFGEPFTVGAALLRYPGDPLGPPAETYNCRCLLLLRTPQGQRVRMPYANVRGGTPRGALP